MPAPASANKKANMRRAAATRARIKARRITLATPSARPSPRPPTNGGPRGIPQWDLFREIGNALRRATGGN